MDTAAACGGPQRWSQRCIGKAVKRRRPEAFLTSKASDRTRDGSLRLLEESLRLPNTDQPGLWRVHNLSRLEPHPRLRRLRLPRYFFVHWSSQPITVSCQRMLFFGFSTQWFSSGK